MREHIFKPAGMISSDSLPEEQAVVGRSVGYTKMDGAKTWLPNTETLPYRGTSAGGGFTTVEDSERFASALLNHKLLDAEHTDLLTTGHEYTQQALNTRTASWTIRKMECGGSGTAAEHRE